MSSIELDYYFDIARKTFKEEIKPTKLFIVKDLLKENQWQQLDANSRRQIGRKFRAFILNGEGYKQAEILDKTINGQQQIYIKK